MFDEKLFEAHEVFGKHMFVRVLFEEEYLPLGLCKCGCIKEYKQGKWVDMPFGSAGTEDINLTKQNLERINMYKKVLAFIKFKYTLSEGLEKSILGHWLNVLAILDNR